MTRQMTCSYPISVAQRASHRDLHADTKNRHPAQENALVIAMLGPLAGKKELKLEVILPNGEISMRTDRLRLIQILINLVNNAVKFTDRGNVQLLIKRRIEHGRTITEFSVVDTGRGITPEDGCRLFEAFFQVQPSCAVHKIDRADGSGLGLHLSKRLANLLGAVIFWESTPGKGSNFTLQFAQERRHGTVNFDPAHLS